MVDNFIHSYIGYKNKNKVRGYQIVNRSYTILFIILIITSILFTTLYLIFMKFFLFFLIVGTYILIKIFDGKLEKALKRYSIEVNKKDINFIQDYLCEKNITDIEQFKILVKMIREKGEENIKKYELTPYIAILVSSLIFIATEIQNLPLFIVLGSGLLLLNPLLNMHANIFHNQKFYMYIDLSKKVEEVYLENSMNNK